MRIGLALLLLLPLTGGAEAFGSDGRPTVALIPPELLMLSENEAFRRAEVDLARKLYGRLGTRGVVTMEVENPCETREALPLPSDTTAVLLSRILSCFDQLPDYVLLVTYAETASRVTVDARIVDQHQVRAALADTYILRDEFLVDGIRAERVDAMADALAQQLLEAWGTSTGATPEGLQPRPPGPSNTLPLIATGATLGLSAVLLWANSDQRNKWNDYEDDTGHPDALYDDYSSAFDRYRVLGYLTGAAAGVSAYLWWRYRGESRVAGPTLQFGANGGRLGVGVRF